MQSQPNSIEPPALPRIGQSTASERGESTTARDLWLATLVVVLTIIAAAFSLAARRNRHKHGSDIREREPASIHRNLVESS